MSKNASDISGHIVIVAHITASPGKGEETEKLIKAVRDSAVSDAEPNTYIYRVSRFGDEFVHFEEYKDADAVAFHTSLPPFAGLVEGLKSGVIAKVDYAHYKELFI